MKKIILCLLILLPGLCHGQEYLRYELAENRVDEVTHDTIKRSYWQVLERGGLSRKLNTFYRISRINHKYFLDLKIIEGGDVFVVARNAELRLVLEDGNILLLHNQEYEVSCNGCGARGYNGSGAQGVMLSFAVSSADLHTLFRHYITNIGINTGEDYLEKKVNDVHSELFVDELRLVYHSL
jgi:hypothetical protein